MRWKDLFFFPGTLTEFLGFIVIIAGSVTGKSNFVIMGLGIIGIGAALTVILFIRQALAWSGSPDQGTRTPADALSENPGDATILYQDHLVRITENSITFHHYSFPLFMSDRLVYFRDIVSIDVKKTALGAGKWRIAGSGDFMTWFPLDGGRPSRDRTFYATLEGKWWTIGFTVENSSRVISILKERGIRITETS